MLQGETSKAVDVLAGACERSPDNYQAMFSFAVALHLIGDVSIAYPEYDIASLFMVGVYCSVTKACARRPGAAASVERR